MLELLRPDAAGRLQTVLSTDVFGLIRALLSFRLFGTDTDYLVIASDSGRLTIVRHDAERNAFKRVHLETYGKTGARRITPGQYLAADPKGRAIMLAAIEKQKLVYVMSHTATEPLTISSPLEAHKSHAIVYDVVGCDVGFDNPVFAALELDYGDVDEDATGDAAAAADKSIVYYELDLGLNSVARKWTRPTDRGASMLVPVPGGADGPGGVLVLCENWILYEHSTAAAAVRTPIPRRESLPDERGLLLVGAAVHRRKGGAFFALVQSELGDLYKVTLVTAPGPDASAPPVVTDVVVAYFDSVPVGTGLAITRSGLLFVASEAGAHLLYQFTSLGEADEGADFVAHAVDVAGAAADGGAVEIACPTFTPRVLTNLAKVDELSSLAPTTALTAVPSAAVGGAGASHAVAPPAPGHVAPSQLLTLCGRGPRSTLRLLRQGLPVAEMAVSPMPGSPTAVFTLPMSAASPLGPHRYIVISFTNATLALGVGDTVEEVAPRETGLADGVPTLALCLLADDSTLQVHPGGMRHIHGAAGAGPKRIAEWRAPGKRVIVRAAVNARQALLALSGGELVYFEVDDGGNLAERERKTLGSEITALALGQVPEGRLRAPHAAAADSNNIVRVLSLDPAAPLSQVSAQALRAPAESLAIALLRPAATAAAGPAAAAGAAAGAAAVAAAPPATPFLFIGLSNGILTRLRMDAASGLLSDPRSRYLGVRPVRLAPASVGGADAVLALSTRSWLHYGGGGVGAGGGARSAPLCYDALESAAPFSSDAVPEGGLVAVAGDTLRIIALDERVAAAGGGGAGDAAGAALSVKSLPLRYTPRRVAVHPGSGRLAVIVEADHGALGAAGRIAAAAADGSGAAAAPAAAAAEEDAGDNMEVDMEVDTAGGAPSSLVTASWPCGPNEIPPSSLSTPGEAPGIADAQAEGIDVRRVGPPLPPVAAGRWGSAIRLVDLSLVAGSDDATLSASLHHPATAHLIELRDDEAALSVAIVPFHDHEGEAFVLVGTARGLGYHPRVHRGGAIHVYRLVEADVPVDAAGAEVAVGAPEAVGSRRGPRLQLQHVTPVEDVPYTIAPLAGRVIVGVGTTLRLYDLGKRRLLRKTEVRGFPTAIVQLAVTGDRAFVGDAAESVHVVKYKRAENALVVFADDIGARHITALLSLDHDTVAGGDKFGNVFVLRVPTDAADDLENPTGSRLLWDAAVLNGAPNKLETVAEFHVGEAVTGLTRASLGGGEVRRALAVGVRCFFFCQCLSAPCTHAFPTTLNPSRSASFTRPSLAR